MAKPKLAMYWAASCGGCEISVLNIHEHILTVDEVFDIAFFPCIADFKVHHVEEYPDDHIDVCLWNGAIRNSEGEHMAKLFDLDCADPMYTRIGNPTTAAFEERMASLEGALGGLALSGNTMNLYSQIGLIMLIGLAAKNGILIVEFINQKRDEGMSFEQAILEGSSKRLRPIAMTAFTTVMGAVPLVLSAGPGHEARTVIGVVVMCGVALATLITLFLVPMAYHLLAAGSSSPRAVARQLEEELP